MAKKALKVAEREFGSDHPDVATDLNNLADLYRAQGRHSEAEPLHKRTLAICEKALGPEHPDVATVRENIAALHSKMGKPEDTKRGAE